MAKKPLKFHQTLNLPPRSAKHGQHRRPRPPSHRNPADGADHGSGGTDQDRTVTVSWSTLNTVSSFDPFIPFEPKPPAIPNAGIRTGELIGHRLWWVIGGKLCSLAHRRLWEPGETIYGDTNRPADTNLFSMFFKPIWGGTYAFRDAERLAPEAEEINERIAKFADALKRGLIPMPWGFYPALETTTFVAGTIKMWGDVVEHEHGYRAEFAKLNSIDNIYGPGELIPLRERYGVGALTTDV